jgi:hypothetical protein
VPLPQLKTPTSPFTLDYIDTLETEIQGHPLSTWKEMFRHFPPLPSSADSIFTQDQSLNLLTLHKLKVDAALTEQMIAHFCDVHIEPQSDFHGLLYPLVSNILRAPFPSNSHLHMQIQIFPKTQHLSPLHGAPSLRSEAFDRIGHRRPDRMKAHRHQRQRQRQHPRQSKHPPA